MPATEAGTCKQEVPSVAAWVYEPFVLEQTVERKQVVYKIMENIEKRKRKTII